MYRIRFILTGAVAGFACTHRPADGDHEWLGHDGGH